MLIRLLCKLEEIPWSNLVIPKPEAEKILIEIAAPDL
jgi:hypothetical protein